MSSSTMALARALTKRAKRQHEDSGAVQRPKISLPTELLSTTNVHALSAPDIKSLSSASSSSSVRSADDLDATSLSRSFLSTPITSPETSSVESSPISSELPHRKGMFELSASPRRSATTSGHRSSASRNSPDAPVLPQRALSHSKKAHQELARDRSLSRLSPPPSVLSTGIIVRSSAEFFGGAAAVSTIDPTHPFGNELAQVNEVAEEFGGANALLDEEEREMRVKGLMKFNAEDYVNEILGLWGGRFEGGLTGMASPWI